jgi:hypothetical protein
LNESNRVHAAIATAGNWISKAETCDFSCTSLRRRDEGSEVMTPGPTLLPYRDRPSRDPSRANYPARSDFCDPTRSLTGAVNALFTSLLASCRLCDVEPWAYLRDIFCLLPHWPEHRLLELAPFSWKKTRAAPDVQKRLEQNRFRALTLDARG